jgi:GDPmannose 4,6-dehydratase
MDLTWQNYLLDKGYEVHGIVRRASTFNTDRLDHLYKDPLVDDTNLYLHYGDLADAVQLVKLLYQLQPDEIYNLGAQSHVRVSFDVPEYTGDVTGLGAVRILEAIREAGLVKKSGTTRHPPLKCMGRCRRFPRWKPLHFGRVLLMPVPKCMPTG